MKINHRVRILGFFLVLSIALGASVYFGANFFLRPPHPDMFEILHKEKISLPIITSPEECKKNDGVWGKVGLAPKESCNLPTQDGGKVCRDSDECESYCLAEMTDEMRKTALRGTVFTTNGTCAKWHVVVGCQAFVKKGKAYTICID